MNRFNYIMLLICTYLQIDGQVYTGDHISKIQAKQKACQKFLHKMLERKLSDQSQQGKQTLFKLYTFNKI